MQLEARTFLKSFAKVLAALTAIGALLIAISTIGFLCLFRSHEEAPIGHAEAIRRLEPVWLGHIRPKPDTIRILHHRKETIWDGTTHEEWIVFVTGDLKLDASASPFLRINHPTAWPLPESAADAGFTTPPIAVYIADSHAPSSGSERPTLTRAAVWPVDNGQIARYEFTVID